LMALLGMAPVQLDFRQFALTDPGGGEPLEIGALLKTGALTMDSMGSLAVLGSLDFLEETGAGPALQDPGMDSRMQQILYQAALATNTNETGPPAGVPTGKTALVAEMKGEVLDTAEIRGIRDAAIPVTVLGYQNPKGGEQEDEGLRFGLEQFRQAVQEAKSKLSDKDSERDALAREIFLSAAAGRVQPHSVSAERSRLTAPDMPTQIMTGLSRNLQAGKGEFTLKLEPEGLGEITVKLLAKEGRTTLRIITASAETARLINADILALQNALKPIRVEVQEAVQQTEASSEEAAYFAGFDQFNQFNQYRNQGEPGRSTSGSEFRLSLEGIDEIAGAGIGEIIPAAPQEGDLDMYV